MRYLRLRQGSEKGFEVLTAEERHVLAIYNSERARGLLHDPEWQADMTSLQEIFDRGQQEKLLAQGYRDLGDGLWVGPEL